MGDSVSRRRSRRCPLALRRRAAALDRPLDRHQPGCLSGRRASRTAWTRLPEPSAIARSKPWPPRPMGRATPIAVVAAPGTQALIQLLPRLLPRPPRRHLGLHLRGARSLMASRWRTCVDTVDEIAALGGLRCRGRGQSEQSRRAADRAGRPCRASRAACAARAACSSSMRPSWMPNPSSTASCRGLPPTGSGGAAFLRQILWARGPAARLCDRLARACRAASVAALGPWAVSGAGDRDRPPRRSPTRLGATRRSRGSRERQRGSTPCSSARASRSSAARRFSGWRAIRARHAWFEHLGRQGIWVRNFPSPHEDWLRFGLPGSAGAWRRLEAAFGKRVASSE